MFHPSEAGRDLDMQREGSRGQAKQSFLSDVVSFLSRIFSFLLERYHHYKQLMGVAEFFLTMTKETLMCFSAVLVSSEWRNFIIILITLLLAKRIRQKKCP